MALGAWLLFFGSTSATPPAAVYPCPNFTAAPVSPISFAASPLTAGLSAQPLDAATLSARPITATIVTQPDC